MRRAFEARPHEGIFTTAFAALAKGLAVYEGKSLRSRRYRAGANGVRDAALRRPTFARRIAASAAAAVHPRFEARARGESAGRLSADRRKDGGRL